MGVPAINPQDRHRFVDGQDQLVLAGYYPGLQALIVGPGSEGEWHEKLIDLLAENQINLLRVCMTFGMALTNYKWRHPYQLSDQCCSFKPDDQWPEGNKFDLERFDQSFFDYWNQVLSHAGDHGVVVQACLLDGVHTDAACIINGTSGACGTYQDGSPIWGPFQIYGLAFDYYFSPNSIQGVDRDPDPKVATDQWYSDDTIISYQKALAEKAVETLGVHDNLIWEIINEPNSAASIPRESLDGRSWLEVMTRAVRDADQNRHLIIPADLPGHQAVAGHDLPVGWYNSDQTACSAENTFTLGDTQQFRLELIDQRPPDGYPDGAPLISDNDRSVCPGPVDQLPLWQRRKAWTALVGGGYVSLFVFDLFIEETWNPVGLDNPSVQAGVRFVGLIRKFIGDFQIDLVSTEPRAEALNDSVDTAWSLDKKVAGVARPYVVYFFQQGTATVGSVANPDTCEWFDPRTGDRQNAGGDYSDSTFETPASGTEDDDWVLHIPAAAW